MEGTFTCGSYSCVEGTFTCKSYSRVEGTFTCGGGIHMWELLTCGGDIHNVGVTHVWRGHSCVGGSSRVGRATKVKFFTP